VLGAVPSGREGLSMRAASLSSLTREETFAEKQRKLAEEIRVFIEGVDPVHKSCKTAAVGWDRDDGDEILMRDPGDVGAMPIYKEDWVAAHKIAIQVGFAAQFLPRPTPGADPKGFVWLVYEHGENRRLELACHLKGDRPRLEWTVQGPLARRTLESRISILIPNSVHAAVLEVADSALAIFWEGMK
jgi:hypothetical protein